MKDVVLSALPDVHFHFNVNQRYHYVCRWMRRALREGVQVVVWGPMSVLRPLDQWLWSFDALAFVPHLSARDWTALPRGRADCTPVWLLEQLDEAPLSGRYLLNLGAEIPARVREVRRVIEVVSQENEDRALARQRWREYQAQGFNLVRHDIATAST